MGEEAGMEYSVSVGKSRDAGADAVADRVFVVFRTQQTLTITQVFSSYASKLRCSFSVMGSWGCENFELL